MVLYISKNSRKPVGWRRESHRHRMAGMGIKTSPSKVKMNKMKASGERDEYIDREVKNFQRDFCPYGYLDIQQAILHFDAYGKNSEDLIEAVEEFVNNTETDRGGIDITWLAYEEILQDIRNKIDSRINFDIMNDAEFYTYGNYMATSYDYSEDDIDSLKKAIRNADKKSRNDLLSDEDIVTWLSEVDIDIKELK